MGENNGHKPTLAYKQAAQVPLIGQPFRIIAWFPTVLLACNHDPSKPEPVMVPRGAAAQCPGCKKLFTIQQIALTPDGNVNFEIGVMTPEDAAEMARAAGATDHV